VPVPAQPEVGSLDAKAAGVSCSSAWSGRATDVVKWGYAALVLALMLAVLFVFPGPRWRLGSRGVLALVVFLVFGLLIPTILVTAGEDSKDDEGIEVLDSQQLGIYDTTVVRASDPEALRKWLDERGFRMGPKDEPVLRSYVERGWCFVACRISRDKGDVQEGLIDALALSFPSPAPVYPFALTATSGETDVVFT